MGIENTSLQAEIDKILGAGPKPVHYYYSCELKAKGRIIQVMKLVSLEFEHDYINKFAPVIMAEFAIGAGTFAHDLYPYKSNLEVNLFRVPMSETDSSEDFTQERTVRNFRGALVDKGSKVLEANNSGSTTRATGDLQGIEFVKIQLVDPVVEQLRMATTGGLFPGVRGADLVKALLGGFSKNVNVPREVAVKGVEVVPGYNPELRQHINIPSPTPLMEVPDFIHSKVGGIYPTGMGFYLDKQVWHLYPLYDLTRFDKTPRTLTIINVPMASLPASERTFRVSRNQVTILANGEVKYRDDSEAQQLNSGNGVRFTDARKIIEGFIETTGNVAKAARGKNISEFVTDVRETGLNNVKSGSSRITSNAYLEMSNMARRAGARIMLNWQYSDSELLYPGMPVRLLYMEHDSVETLYGTLLGAHDMIKMEGEGVQATKHISNTALTLFVGRKLNWEKSA